MEWIHREFIHATFWLIMKDISHKQNIYVFLHARGVIHCLKPVCCQLPAKQPSILTAFHSSECCCLRSFAFTLSALGYTGMHAGCIDIISKEVSECWWAEEEMMAQWVHMSGCNGLRADWCLQWLWGYLSAPTTACKKAIREELTQTSEKCIRGRPRHCCKNRPRGSGHMEIS